MTDTTDIKALREGLVELLDHVDSYGGKCWLFPEDVRSIISSLDQLEAERHKGDLWFGKVADLEAALKAERQRADRYHFVAMSALESQAEISDQLGISEDECDGSPEQIHEKIEMLQTELAALKVEQVPVGEIVAWDHPNEERKVNFRFLRFDVQPGTQLFTSPQKPVVLPGIHTDQWGDEFYPVDEVHAAIEDAGGIVKRDGD